MRALVDVTHDLMVCVGKATQEGYVVALVTPDEWAEWYAEEQSDVGTVTVYTPLADLGWQNFICDDENIIVRFEVTG